MKKYKILTVSTMVILATFAIWVCEGGGNDGGYNSGSEDDAGSRAPAVAVAQGQEGVAADENGQRHPSSVREKVVKEADRVGEQVEREAKRVEKQVVKEAERVGEQATEVAKKLKKKLRL